MKNWKATKFIVVCTTIALLFALAGCAPAEEPAANNDAPAVDPDEVYSWTIQTSWPTGILLHEMAEKWGEKVEAASGGRMEIEVLPSGAMVGALEVLDATHTRTIDGMHSWSAYWLGRNTAAPFFSSVPMLFEPTSHVMWMLDRGLDYQNQLYQEELDLNVVAFMCGNTHPEIGAHSNVPLRELDDWIGTSYRVPGWMAEILSDMGVAVTTLPGDEVYPSLERGVIDAAEFSSPVVNHSLGFQEISDYYTGPGIHQPSVVFELVINKDSFNELPADLQLIVEYAAHAVTLETWTEDVVRGSEILEIWQEDYGMERMEISEEAQLEFRQQAWDFIEAELEGNPFAQEVWSDAREFYIEFNDYEKLMVPTRAIPDEWN